MTDEEQKEHNRKVAANAAETVYNVYRLLKENIDVDSFSGSWAEKTKQRNQIASTLAAGAMHLLQVLPKGEIVETEETK